MADENTTASVTTTTDPAAVTETGSPATSTTETTTEGTQPTETTTETTEGGTVLTGKEEASTETVETTEETTDAPNEFFGAPEGDYEIEGLPEGTVIDEKALEVVAPVAKEMGLSNKGLSKIAGVYAEKVLPLVVDQFNEQVQKDVSTTRAEWVAATNEMLKTDPVFKGASLSEVRQISAKALDRFGGQPFREYLEKTGLGDNPDMVKFAYQAGVAISEDTTFERGGQTPVPKSRTEKYYGPQTS